MSRQQLMSLTLVSLVALMTSCNPKAPVDETLQKNHQDTHKLELVFTPGKLEGDKFIIDQSQQSITISASQATKWEQDKPLTLRVGQTYFLHIKHYAKSGEFINREFVTNGEDRIHQHFFIPKNLDGKLKPTDVMEYRYLDTDPWDAPISTDAKVIGKENPIGFKGAISFKIPSKHLTIHLRLMHAMGSKFNRKGEPARFYFPGMWNGNAAYDVDFIFNIQIV